jgi:hypothetical protein
MILLLQLLLLLNIAFFMVRAPSRSLPSLQQFDTSRRAFLAEGNETSHTDNASMSAAAAANDDDTSAAAALTPIFLADASLKSCNVAVRGAINSSRSCNQST